MDHQNLRETAIREAGGRAFVADACGRSVVAVHKWIKKGFPRTEWTGETNYAETIANLTGGKYPKELLLDKTSPGAQ